MAQPKKQQVVGDGTPPKREGQIVGSQGDDDAPAAKAPPVKSVKPKLQPIAPQRVQLAQFKVNAHVADIPNGVTLEDLQGPSYWMNLQHSLKPGDFIIARADNSVFVAILMVRSVSYNDVRVGVVLDQVWDKIDPSFKPPSEYKIEHAGFYDQWRVLRGSDVVVSKMPTYSAAERWLKDYLVANRR